jgi:hypothetical protein
VILGLFSAHTASFVAAPSEANEVLFAATWTSLETSSNHNPHALSPSSNTLCCHYLTKQHHSADIVLALISALALCLANPTTTLPITAL